MQENFTCAPILLIGFNRPDFMRAQIDAVRAAKPPRLYLAVDGPRQNRPGEDEKCRAVQDCVRLVDWPCEVKTLCQEKNLGCKYAPAKAIDWFFKNEEHGIVLEDDCRPTAGFLRFATEMLDRYKDDDKVGVVTGYNMFGLQHDQSVSYHFSSDAKLSGGWATWRRVWKDYDIEMKPYLGTLDETLRTLRATPYFKRVFRLAVERVVNYGLDAWDVQFSLMIFATHRLGVVPRTQIVRNVGFDVAAATHTVGYNYYSKNWIRSGTLAFPLVHPQAVVCDEWADRRREQMEGAIFPRGLTWLGCKVPHLAPFLSAVGGFAEKLAPILFRL